MKKHIILFSLLVSIIAALLPTTAQALPTSGQRGLITWKKSGEFNAIKYGEVDSITYSRVGLDGNTYPNVVVQVVWTQDSVYRVPIADIDTIAFKTPNPVEKDNVFHIRDFHYPYVTDVTGLTVTFDASIPADSLPGEGQVVVSDRAYKEPFMHGFAGRVISIVRSDGVVRIVCESVTVQDIFDELIWFGTVVATSEDSDLTRNRAIIDEQGDTTIYISPQDIDIINKDNTQVVLTVAPQIKIEYQVYVKLLEKPKLTFIVSNDSHCNLGVNWNKSVSVDEEIYPLSLDIPLVPEIGLTAFIELGGYFNFSGTANLGLNFPFNTYTQFGFVSNNQNQNQQGLWLGFKQPEWGTIDGYANFEADLAAGVALKVGACIYSEDAVSANFTMKLGPRLQGKLGFNTNEATVYSNHYGDSITFTPLTAALFGGVKLAVPDIIEIIDKEWQLAEIPLTTWFPNVEFFKPKTLYLLPKFSNRTCQAHIMPLFMVYP